MPRKVAIRAAMVATALIVFKAALNIRPIWEATLFPWIDYLYFQSYWLFPLSLYLFGLAIFQLPVTWNRYVVATISLCIFLFSLWTGRWLFQATDDSSQQTADANHHCRQTTLYTCAPAACVSLLSYWGIPATEGEMARLCMTNENGTSHFNVFRGLMLKTSGRPYRVQMLEIDSTSLASLGVPAVIGIKDGHAMVAKIEGNKVLVHDPLMREPKTWDLKVYQRFLRDIGVVVLPRTSK